MAKCSGPRCPVLLLQHVARVTWYMKSSRQPPAASHQERGGHQFVPLGGSSELLIDIQIVHISTSPHHITLIPPLTRSSSFMTVCTLVVSVEGMEAVGSGVSAWSDSGQLVTSRVNELTFPSPRRQSGAHYAYYFYQTSHYSIISSNRVHCSVSTYRGYAVNRINPRKQLLTNQKVRRRERW